MAIIYKEILQNKSIKQGWTPQQKIKPRIWIGNSQKSNFWWRNKYVKRGSNSNASREITKISLWVKSQRDINLHGSGGKSRDQQSILQKGLWRLVYISGWKYVSMLSFWKTLWQHLLVIKNTYIFDSEILLPETYLLGMKASKPKDIFTQKWTAL